MPYVRHDDFTTNAIPPGQVVAALSGRQFAKSDEPTIAGY
jgi:hypothetical protein